MDGERDAQRKSGKGKNKTILSRKRSKPHVAKVNSGKELSLKSSASPPSTLSYIASLSGPNVLRQPLGSKMHSGRKPNHAGKRLATTQMMCLCEPSCQQSSTCPRMQRGIEG